MTLPWRRGAFAAAALLAGALLVLGFAGALQGPLPGPLAPARAFAVQSVELGSGEGLLTEGQAWIGQVPVRSLLLRDVTAALTWTDDEPGSAPDEFTLELVPPEGILPGPPAEGAGGTLEVRVPVYASPPPRAELGVGAWNVRVYLRSAGDGSTLGLLPGALDEGNDFHLAVTASVFEYR